MRHFALAGSNQQNMIDVVAGLIIDEGRGGRQVTSKDTFLGFAVANIEITDD